MLALRPYWLGLALVLMEAPLPVPAQYPGNGGLGIPIPRHRNKKKEEQAQLQSTSGMLRRVRKDDIVMEADDHRIMNFKRTDTTHFLKLGNAIKPGDLTPGDYIEVEASEDEEGFLTAVNVMWQQDGSAKDRKHAVEPVETSLAKSEKESAKAGAKDNEKDDDSTAGSPVPERPAPQSTKSAKNAAPPAAAPVAAPADDPNPADLNAPVKEEVKSAKIDDDDQGAPVLKRGGKAVRKDVAPPPPQSAMAETAPVQTARNEPPEESEQPAARNLRPEEAVIEKAREASVTFIESLPNYVCQELMTRYQSESNSKNFVPLDVISMALVYDHGQESYRNLQVNGKATKKSIEDLSGSWSTGEFGSVLADIFSPATAADFEYRKESRSAGRASLLYNFSVEREHSHWRVMVASQMITPSYKGSVWVDKETNRVLRIEMQATHIPEAFPSDKVEMATDYEFVRFGERQYLVPTHAETLSCQRDSSTCSRNAIDFRNYHKFSGESSITFDK